MIVYLGFDITKIHIFCTFCHPFAPIVVQYAYTEYQRDSALVDPRYRNSRIF